LSWWLFSEAIFGAVMETQNSCLTKAQISRTYQNLDSPIGRMMLRFYQAVDPEKVAGWDKRLAEAGTG